MTSGKKQAAAEVNDGVLMVQPSNLKALCQRVRMLMEIGDLEKVRDTLLVSISYSSPCATDQICSKLNVCVSGARSS